MPPRLLHVFRDSQPWKDVAARSPRHDQNCMNQVVFASEDPDRICFLLYGITFERLPVFPIDA
jgi:hypothetical protein